MTLTETFNLVTEKNATIYQRKEKENQEISFRLVQISESLLHLDMSSNGLLQLNPPVGKLKELRFLDLK